MITEDLYHRYEVIECCRLRSLHIPRRTLELRPGSADGMGACPGCVRLRTITPRPSRWPCPPCWPRGDYFCRAVRAELHRRPAGRLHGPSRGDPPSDVLTAAPTGSGADCSQAAVRPCCSESRTAERAAGWGTSARLPGCRKAAVACQSGCEGDTGMCRHDMASRLGAASFAVC